MELPRDDNLAEQAFDALFRGEHVRALAMIDQLLAAEPDNAVYRCWHSRCLLAVGSPAEALEAARAAVRLAPDLVQAYLPLAWAAACVNRHDEADEAFRKAVELSAREPYVLAEYANFLAAEGDPAAAEHAAREALAAEPQSPNAWAALGWAQFRQGRADAAEVNLRRALSFMPESPRASAYLALVLRNTGRASEAAELPQPPGGLASSVPLAGYPPPAPARASAPAPPPIQAPPPAPAPKADAPAAPAVGRRVLQWSLWIFFWAAVGACTILGVYNIVAGVLMFLALVAVMVAIAAAMKMLGPS